MESDEFDFLQEPVDPKDLVQMEAMVDQAWTHARERDADMAQVIGRITGFFDATPDEAKTDIEMTFRAHDLIAIVMGLNAARVELVAKKARAAPVKSPTLTDADLPHTIPVEPMPVGSRYLDPETNTVRCGCCTRTVRCPACEGGEIMRETITIHGRVYTPGEDDGPDAGLSGVLVTLGRDKAKVAEQDTDAGGYFSFREQPWKPGFQIGVNLDDGDVELDAEIQPDDEGTFRPTGPGKVRIDFKVTN